MGKWQMYVKLSTDGFGKFDIESAGISQQDYRQDMQMSKWTIYWSTDLHFSGLSRIRTCSLELLVVHMLQIGTNYTYT